MNMRGARAVRCNDLLGGRYPCLSVCYKRHHPNNRCEGCPNQTCLQERNTNKVSTLLPPYVIIGPRTKRKVRKKFYEGIACDIQMISGECAPYKVPETTP